MYVETFSDKIILKANCRNCYHFYLEIEHKIELHTFVSSCKEPHSPKSIFLISFKYSFDWTVLKVFYKIVMIHTLLLLHFAGLKFAQILSHIKFCLINVIKVILWHSTTCIKKSTYTEVSASFLMSVINLKTTLPQYQINSYTKNGSFGIFNHFCIFLPVIQTKMKLLNPLPCHKYSYVETYTKSHDGRNVQKHSMECFIK